MRFIQSVWIVILVIICLQLEAQSPYHFSWKKDVGLVALGGATVGLGAYYRSNLPILTAGEIENLNPNNVNGFDRVAIDNYFGSADRLSDYFWGGSHLLPALFLSGKKTRQDFGAIAGLWGEVFFINVGITILTKNTFRRTRPFVYNPAASIERKFTKTARSSFISGHTSMTAANCFFAAKVFADYYPESRWKPAIWTTAAIIPAITGYLRVRAGKHFPTDTIAGYLVGATTGILVPQLHKKKKKRDNISFYGGPGGALVQVKF